MNEFRNTLVPMVRERSGNSERVMDIYSKMLEERVVYMDGEVTSHMISILKAQLLYLDSIGHDDITLNIDSPGGSVHAGLALYDTMQYIKSDVRTVVIGLAASMGSFIAQAGAKGKRFITPQSTTMIHRVSSGTRGTGGTIYEQELQFEDAKRSFEHSQFLNKRLTELYAHHNSAGKDFKFFQKAMKHDTWLTAEEAIKMGLADKIV